MTRNTNLKSAICNCTSLCYREWTIRHLRRPIHKLLELFMGIPEDSPEVVAGRFGPVVLCSGLLTAPLPSLLYDGLPNDSASTNRIAPLWNSCRELVLGALDSDPDACAGKVLEHSFLWSLAVRSAMEGGLAFGKKSFSFRCAGIQAARIFFKGRPEIDEARVRKTQAGILYYADEARTPHPAADMWFQSVDGRLVLVEIGGTVVPEEAQDKVKAMSAVLRGLNQFEGVVLLPNICEPIHDSGGRPVAVTGLEAQRLLGGLAQVLTWLGDQLD